MEVLYLADTLRIAVDELKRRMEAGEDFTLIDECNPQAWAESGAPKCQNRSRF
jgi:hypothetical protein